MSLEQMNQTLRGLKVGAHCVAYQSVRHHSLFDIELHDGVKIRAIESVLREIGLRMKSVGVPDLRMSGGCLRLTMPHSPPQMVKFNELLSNAGELPNGTLPLLLGESESGLLWTDMAKFPHILAAGTTGSGKSVFLHTLMANLIVLNTQNFRKVNVYLVDPKQNELLGYKDLPFVKGACFSYDDALAMMLKVAELMEARYSKFAELGIRSIEECYYEFDQTVVIIDEVVDLFLQDQSGELKKLITRISQKARAAGIYLVLATQRPSKDVFPTTLKANFGRVACRTTSRVDSEVVLDDSGAEKLLGRGDAFIKNMEHDMVRFQVAYSDLKRNLKMYEYLMKLN